MIDPLKLPSPNAKKNPFFLILFGIGLVLIVLQLLLNSGNYFYSWFIHVQYPSHYEFNQLDSVLKQYVHEKRYYHLVDYSNLKHSKEFHHAVSELAHISPDRLNTPAQQLCFWINTYNLLVIDGIVARYPLSSPQGRPDIFSLHKYIVGGVPLSIDNIFELKLTPLFKQVDVKAIFLCCGGTLGDPAVPDHAINQKDLNDDIQTAMLYFINNPDNVRFDPANGNFYISPFFSLNATLLSQNGESMHAFVNYYLPADKQLNLTNFHIKQTYFSTFNWQLNDLKIQEIPPAEAVSQ